MKNIFSLQTNLTGYLYPLVKIILSGAIILFCIFRNLIFNISVKPLKILVAAICCALTIGAILCIYVAVGELFYVRKNRKNKS